MKKFYFFDLDGTLADSDADIRLAWKAALADMGVDAGDFDALFVAGPTLEDMAKKLYPDLYSDSFASELRRLFGVHYDSDGFPATREYPGVMDRVRELKTAGAGVYIVTNKRMAGAKAMARHFGWDRVFDGIYAGDMYAADPAVGKLRKGELLRHVLEVCGATAADSVMVGDTANDFNAARENGIDSVAVLWGYGKPEEHALATRTASSPADI